MIQLTPDSLRLTNQPAQYLGEAPVGQTKSLPCGALVSLNGLPVLMPAGQSAGAQQGDYFLYTDLIPRFDARYWVADGQRTSSFALTARDSSNFTVVGTFAAKNNLVGIQWFSADTLDHPMLAYIEDADYTGATLNFRIRVSSELPTLDDPTLGMSLTVKTGNGTYYVRLANYCTGSGRDLSVSLPFGQVYAGFSPTSPNWHLLPATGITEMFLSVVPPNYSATDTSPLPAPLDWKMTVSDISCSGQRRTLVRRRVRIQPHTLRMCTAYDDHYNLAPARIIENLLTLGYRDWINHYCGMSHYMRTHWDTGRREYIIDQNAAPDINIATAAWHRDFLSQAKSAKFTVIQSVSYEIFSESCPFDWAQRDWDGVLGTTGYTPPSYLISPCSDQGIDYIGGIMLKFATIAKDCGMPVYVQIGEPWWWFQPSTQKPCVYDYPTKLRYFNETGNYAPNLGTISVASQNQTSEAIAFQSWLAGALDKSNQRMRAIVKKAIPSASVAPLFFLPSILDTQHSGIMSRINYPAAQYSYPHYDFMQTEAYDWTTAGLNDAQHAYRSFTAPTTELGYPQNLIHVLAGYADTPDIYKWRYIFQLIQAGHRDFPGINIYVWAYPQVMRDGILYIAGDQSFIYGGAQRITTNS